MNLRLIIIEDYRSNCDYSLILSMSPPWLLQVQGHRERLQQFQKPILKRNLEFCINTINKSQLVALNRSER